MARIAIIVRPEALDAVRAQCEALLGAGHAVHLGLTGEVDAAALTALWNAWPGLSIGHAVPRRDRWARLGPKLSPALAAALPPDPGIRAYLAQLDLDLLLLATGAQVHTLEADYLDAARSLRLATAVMGQTPEAALAQAAPGAVAPPAPQAGAVYEPLLWAMWAWDEIANPAEPQPAGGAEDAGGFSRRIGDAYADAIFPALTEFSVSLAPETRPLARAELQARLGKGVLANELAAERAMAEAAEGDAPIAIGPWWGDPDQEILYWAPFVRSWRRRYGVDKERIVVIAGGGSAAWYDGAAGQYLDLAELYDPQALAEMAQARTQELAGRRKRFGVTEADRQLLKRLNRRLGFRGLKTLPPWTMAVMLERYWSGQAGPALLTDRTRPQALKMKDKRARQLVPGLPADFVAVGLPDRLARETELRMGVKAMAWRAAARMDVVLLAEPACADWARGIAGGKVRVLELEPANAKGVASAVMAAATGYIGPSGWMAWAAAAYGKPAVCLSHGPGERELIDMAAASRMFSPAPLAIDLSDLGAMVASLELLLAGATPADAAH